jgi:hypothetical protein
MAKRKNQSSSSSSSHSSSTRQSSNSSNSSKNESAEIINGVSGARGEPIKYKAKFYHKAKLPSGTTTYSLLPVGAIKEALYTIAPDEFFFKRSGFDSSHCKLGLARQRASGSEV